MTATPHPGGGVLTAATETSGLRSAEAAAALRRDGPNALPPPARPHPVRQLLAQMTHRFALMLWAAAVLALLAGMVPLAAAIGVVVLVNGCFAFWQEYRADRAAERLAVLVPSRARVRRDGEVRTVDTAQVVVGDVVLLAAGDRVCADLTVLDAHALSVDESLLTGESVAARPGPGDPLLCGTFVVEGEAAARADRTGTATRLAGISALTRGTSRSRTPLARELDRVVRVVSYTALAVGVVLAGGALLLGLSTVDALVFGLGVMVALVPEGLLPTVTLSLARSAQQMASRQALVRRLDAVETLGAPTFVCTDKTGTLTRNHMTVARVWTPRGEVALPGSDYDPTVPLPAAPADDGGAVGVDGATAGAVDRAVRRAARSAALCVQGRAVLGTAGWAADGDPMEAALDVVDRRLTAAPRPAPLRRYPYTAARRRSAVLVPGAGPAPGPTSPPALPGAGEGAERPDVLHVLGAPESVLAVCVPGDEVARAAVRADELAASGLRVVAVARRTAPGLAAEADPEHDLVLTGLLALEDPPLDDVAGAVAACHEAGIRLAMVTGDHPATAAAVARQVGLLRGSGPVLVAADLPDDPAALAGVLDHPDGAVVARVGPEDKLRIAQALQSRGHVVAMTGDGVNDAPALRVADVGVAMGRGGSDVAREASDLVLLDDRFGTIVAAVELGRATTHNIRRFLTYHLTDNVAELAPFVLWALTAGQVPLAIGVLQVLALDIGTDLLPALALGAEPPHPRTLHGPVRAEHLVDRHLLARAFGVLGLAEAVGSLATFLVVLLAGGWSWGATPRPALLATASGAAFAAIVLGQLVNAVACRSRTRPVTRMGLRGNPLLPWALASEAVALALVLGLPPVASLLGGTWPDPRGWACAVLTGTLVAVADATHKRLRVHHDGGLRGDAVAAPRPGR
ncbi:cation-transporting P-type ATPase [Cellulomonas sp. C5510]|uniref:cation-translocating P-type ATPase n=1 Tax=Cellulomonas sp. C5510 TaxID=2871170 RepID=UPI001C9741CD|nr:cation-transporting P-type ATPase [Cellulomonas sp. C5510]QZN86973.1 cation-transporting P-type ATPase [Cellulomonas sp. C5510]